ncbi:hypothetical protein FBU59_003960, partial [Linderina macrospora]
MPSLGSSPSDESLQFLTQGRADGEEDEVHKVSRLHRRLSMQMMKRERERQERQIERARRNLVEAAGYGRSRTSKTTQKSSQQKPDTGNKTEAERTHGNQLASKPSDPDAAPSRYNAPRLISNLNASTTDDIVREQRYTEFPELKDRKGKSRTKYTSMGSKNATQPIFDMLSNSSQRMASQGSAEATKDAPPPLSRIPAYRAPTHVSQATKVTSDVRDDRKLPANVRPLSSFGKPPAAKNSNIPRAPNLRTRPTSPIRSSTRGSETEEQKGSSNVFLRLARRLNSAKGAQNASSVLGTMPRKMNLLLPAAAQYMTQHPKRPAMSQVQVFQAKPVSESATDRKPSVPRRHSYQPQPLDTDPHRHSFPRHRLAPIGKSQSSGHAHGDGDDDDDEFVMVDDHHVVSDTDSVEPAQLHALGSQSLNRRRAATVARVQSRAPPLSGRYGNIQPLPHQQPKARTMTSDQTRQTPSSRQEPPSTPSRASSIIPSITRRLGLGFPFGHRSGDDQSRSAQPDSKRRIVTPPPPPIDTTRSIPRRISGSLLGSISRNKRPDRAPIPAAFNEELTEPSGSSSASISIDSSSDSDGGIDDHIDYRRLSYRSNHTANMLTSSQVDLIMSSPVSTKRRPGSIAHTHSTDADSDGNISILDTDLRHVLESNRRR